MMGTDSNEAIVPCPIRRGSQAAAGRVVSGSVMSRECGELEPQRQRLKWLLDARRLVFDWVIHESQRDAYSNVIRLVSHLIFFSLMMRASQSIAKVQNRGMNEG